VSFRSHRSGRVRGRIRCAFLHARGRGALRRGPGTTRERPRRAGRSPQPALPARGRARAAPAAARGRSAGKSSGRDRQPGAWPRLRLRNLAHGHAAPVEIYAHWLRMMAQVRAKPHTPLRPAPPLAGPSRGTLPQAEQMPVAEGTRARNLPVGTAQRPPIREAAESPNLSEISRTSARAGAKVAPEGVLSLGSSSS